MIRRRARAPAWSIPAWYASLAILGGLYLPRLEARFGMVIDSGVEPASILAMFAAIASGMIALTGIVFSLAFVMVQFSATAYSPRLVLWIARDPLLWHAVGIFSATFLYGLGAMAWVQHARAGGGVPFFSAWLVIVLLVASVAVFIALIEKLSLLQVHRMLAFTAEHGRRVIEETYPPFEMEPAMPEPEALRRLPVSQVLAHVGPPRCVQAIETARLLGLASRSGGIMEVQASVGDTLVLGTPMLKVHGGAPVDEAKLRAAFALGAE